MSDKIKTIFSDKKARKILLINVIILIGLFYAFFIYNYGILKILRYFILLESLFIIAWIDYKEQIIPNRFLAVMIGIRTFILVIEWLVYENYGLSIFLGSLMGAVIGFGVFGLCFLVSRGGMGAGDVKLMAVLGYYLGGSDIMFVMILTVCSAGIYNGINLIRKKTTLKSEVPFGPFVLIGTVLAMALGV